ncbi:hypothetical protein VY88_24090 [Azospirillum thiophilum]|uniref:Uncharacterized protein n=2 Tax=Azospirillum thiophilum TaxID=528244 RepID=A0AAC8W1Q6_9PROT|nr:hypothetical protein AL072_19685 [Azospirillum thiophilum]KJR63216.1 hypothetical protein VY88_24090 [Azospirillum thiophilum]
MTPRGSDAVETGAGARTPPATSRGGTADRGAEAAGSEPLVNRFPTIAFSYDTDASRLVMLYRDPANGKTVSQIPTEAALKQYKDAQQQEKEAERATLLKLTVDGNGGGYPAADGRAGGALPATAAGKGNWSVDSTGSTGTHAASVAFAASARASSVAPSGGTVNGSAGASTARVNMVI